jgi:hypothetical protein
MYARDQAGERQRPTRSGRAGHGAAAGKVSAMHPADPGRLLGLQRLVGNAAVGRIVAPPPAEVSVQRDRGRDPAFDAGRAPVDAVLRSPGEPLAPAVRADMEAVTGRDQSAVRIHRDATADYAAKSLGAEAFTTGSHIAFQRGRYDPTSHAGRRRLRHELKHVEQQSRGEVAGTDLGNGMRISHPSDRHEKEAVAASDELPAQRTIDEREPAGEAAGTVSGPALPAQRTVVQRDVGFEFEAGSIDTSTSVYNTPVTDEDRNQPGHPPRGRAAGQFEPRHPPAMKDQMRAMHKHEKLLTGQGFHVEADASIAGSSLEFVVAHVPETPAGRAQLLAAMQAVLAIARLVIPPGIHRATDLAVGGATAVPVQRGYAVVGRSSGPLIAKPQATGGIRLDRLDELMRYVSAPEGKPAPTVKSAVTPQERAFVDLNDMDRYNQIVNQATQHTARTIERFRSRPDVPEGFGSPQLSGLVDLVVSYILEAGRGVAVPYPKAIAPMLSRTDLTTVFDALPEADFLRKDDGANFVDLVLDNGRLGADLPVIAGGITQYNRQQNAFDHVTRGRWLREITAGTDILSPHGYKEVFPSAKGNQGRSDDLESMGALEDKMDPVGPPEAGLKAPIIELRRMRDIEVGEWMSLALGVFDLIVALNANEPLNYAPPPAEPAPAPPAPGGPAPGPSSGAPPKDRRRDAFKKGLKGFFSK